MNPTRKIWPCLHTCDFCGLACAVFLLKFRKEFSALAGWRRPRGRSHYTRKTLPQAQDCAVRTSRISSDHHRFRYAFVVTSGTWSRRPGIARCTEPVLLSTLARSCQYTTSAWIPAGENSLNPLGGMSNWRNWPSLTVRLTAGRAKKKTIQLLPAAPGPNNYRVKLHLHGRRRADRVDLRPSNVHHTGLHAPTRYAVSFFDHMVSFSGPRRTRKNRVRIRAV